MKATTLRRLAVVLRVVSLALRSLLVFALAGFLDVADVGLYGLLTVTVAYAMYPLGFDFYTYSTRQMMRNDHARWPTFLTSQAALSSVLYLVILPLLLLLFASGQLPWSVAPWFYILIPLEHLGIELERVLIAASATLGASVSLFVRQGLMPLVLLGALAVTPAAGELGIVLSLWAGCDLVGVLIALVLVRRRLHGYGVGTVDWAWLRRGVRVSGLLLVGTLSLRALFTADRQILLALTDFEVVGGYTLFVSVGNGITGLISAGVHQFKYPELVRLAHQADVQQFVSVLQRMLVQTMLVALLGSFLAIVLLPSFLDYVGRESYGSHAWVLPWVLASTCLYNLSLVPHFVLYALDADRAIVAIAVLGLVVFVAVVAAMAATWPVEAVLVAVFGACLVLLLGKTVAALIAFRRRLSRDLAFGSESR